MDANSAGELGRIHFERLPESNREGGDEAQQHDEQRREAQQVTAVRPVASPLCLGRSTVDGC